MAVDNDLVQATLSAALDEPGCPVCTVVQRYERRYFWEVLWERANDPGFRAAVRASIGFCPAHTRALMDAHQTELHDALGTAILLAEFVGTWQGWLLQRCATGPTRTPAWPQRRRGPRWAICPACANQRAIERDMLGRLVDRFRHSARFRRAYRASDGLCARHLTMAIGRAESAASELAELLVHLRARLREGAPWTRPELLASSPPAVVGDEGPPAVPRCTLCQPSREAAHQALVRGPGQGLGLCMPHLREAVALPTYGQWIASASQEVTARIEAVLEGHALGTSLAPPCGACLQAGEVERAEAKRLLQPPSRGDDAESPVVCLPHLLQLGSAREGGDELALMPEWLSAAERRLREVAAGLGGFIRKQDWNSREPLTQPERVSLLAAVSLVAGEHVAGRTPFSHASKPGLGRDARSSRKDGPSMVVFRYLLVALGGALGAASRYAVSGWVAERAGPSFPWGTAVINLAGSFLLGLIGTLSVERLVVPPEWLTFLGVGFLGGFTTFSTWQYETFRLLDNGGLTFGLVNLFGSALLGLISVAAGVVLGRWL